MTQPQITAALLSAVLALAGAAHAETPGDFLKTFEAQARQADPAFKGFSGPRGEQFFKTRKGGEWSCSSCHTDNPGTAGKHAKTDKAIDPLAPAANPERFTSAAKVAKWFRRNCNDTLGRECTAQEKGDVLSYLVTIRK
jgi:mono/diheme cytochrome c family protein